MRVLWITNAPIAIHRKQLGLTSLQSGGWMDASFDLIKSCLDLEVGLASVYSCDKLMSHECDGIKMYEIPNDLKGGSYQYNKSCNIEYWRQVISDFKPDIIHIWGTEMAHSLCVLKAAPTIPAVVYLQGLMAQINNHSHSGIDLATKLRYTSIRDIIDNKGISFHCNSEIKRARIEAEIIKRAGNVIVENEWAEMNCLTINNECKIFRSLLPINKSFSEFDWSHEGVDPYTIFTTAGGYPIKGHHFLIKALAIIKKVYPEVKLIIPGYNPVNDDTGLRRMFPLGYTKYIKSLIKQYGLEDNIQYVGKISLKEMAYYMSKSSVFVMPSAIENHSSTLIEAMMVGAPCVSSYVGGVSEYLRNGQNGFLYRYDEPETLAGLVIRLLGDKILSERIGCQAKIDTRKTRLSINAAEDFINAYQVLIKQKENEDRRKE